MKPENYSDLLDGALARIAHLEAQLAKYQPRRPEGAPLVYVSGPMTGMPGLNFPAFHKAAASLRASGYTVINPAEFDEADGPVQYTWEQYLARDLKALVDCTHIALLPGWERSDGARLEKHNADALKIRPIFLTQEA